MADESQEVSLSSSMSGAAGKATDNTVEDTVEKGDMNGEEEREESVFMFLDAARSLLAEMAAGREAKRAGLLERGVGGEMGRQEAGRGGDDDDDMEEMLEEAILDTQINQVEEMYRMMSSSSSGGRTAGTGSELASLSQQISELENQLAALETSEQLESREAALLASGALARVSGGNSVTLEEMINKSGITDGKD